METLKTKNLHLIALSPSQLVTGLQSIQMLSATLGIPLTQSLFKGVVEHAVKMKIEKMKTAPEYTHSWFTYWLIVIVEENIGAGLIGFKGNPNQEGAVEIGYGIDEPFRKKGYMTEAVRSLAKWAFSHSECRKITATGVLPTNIGSQKVLLNSGFQEISSQPEGISYRLERDLFDQIQERNNP